MSLGAAVIVTSLLAADRFFPPNLTRAQHEGLMLLDGDQTPIDVRTSTDGYVRLRTTRRDVDPAYLACLLRTEDKRFFLTPGIDPIALARAAGQFLTRGHVVSGGSTLAMQTARLLTPHPHTLTGKFQDMARAIQLVWRYGHGGVLDLYLTLAPEGRNVEGIRAASWRWFGHAPDHLTEAQAALLVALPRNPSAYTPDRHASRALFAIARVLHHAPVTPLGLAQPLQHDAPSLLGRLWAQGERGIVRTTLSRSLQQAVQRRMAKANPPEHGSWAALVLRPDATIAVWIGHAHPASATCPGCDADMVTAWRSPGSALKPFIYGLAFDRGLLTPQSRVNDAALRIGTYRPHDFDRRLHGTTDVATALQQSLNLPAVRTLARLGPRYFRDMLDHAGITLRLPPHQDTPGLALALGGEGTRMLDLAAAYHGLAAGGLITQPRLHADEPQPPGHRLMRVAAAEALLTILRGTPRPAGLPPNADPGLAFKTGTSYGGRDAWACGIDHGWTIIVWAGRPDGTASPGITGRDTASPLLAAIVDTLPRPETGFLPALALTSPSTVDRSDRRQSTPHILSPPDDATIEAFAEGGEATPIGLDASGGTPPYRWFIDGTPLSIPLGATPNFRPVSPGFARIALVDAAGQRSIVRIRVR